jgi:hypothetical protein
MQQGGGPSTTWSAGAEDHIFIVSLNSGDNTVELQKGVAGWGYVDIDYLDVSDAPDLSSEPRLEAEAATRSTGTNSPQIDVAATASGGYFVNLNGGTTTFNVNAPASGQYQLWFAMRNRNNGAGMRDFTVAVGGTPVGKVVAQGANEGPWPAETLVVGSVALSAGNNAVALAYNTSLTDWGWLECDYLIVLAEPSGGGEGEGEPQFTVHTRAQWLEVGDDLVLTVEGGGGTITYQWIKDDGDLLHETNDTYEKDSVTTDDEGAYQCRVTVEAKTVYLTPPIHILVFLAGELPVAGLAGLALLLTACGFGAVKLLRRKQ